MFIEIIQSHPGIVIVLGVLLLGFTLYMLLTGAGQQQYASGKRPWVSVFAAERAYKMDRPIKLSGVPDLIAKDAFSRLVIVDLKTRKRAQVFPYDRVQLSSYALMVSEETGMEILDHGYVTIRNQDGESYHRVPLMSPNEIVALYHRYKGIMAGEIEPCATSNPNICRHCQFVGRECPGAKK